MVSSGRLSRTSRWGSGSHGTDGHEGTLLFGHLVYSMQYVHPSCEQVLLLLPHPIIGEEGQIEGTWLRGGRAGVP